MKKLLLLFVLMLLPMVASAYDFKKDGFYYLYDATTQSAIVTFGDEKYSGEIIIPQNVVYNTRSMDVTGIGKNAFAWCKDLISIKLPESVITLDEWSFSGCSSLSHIDLSNVKTISSSSFRDCVGLKRMIIPGTVEYIGTGAFENCVNLKTLVIKESQTSLYINSGSANSDFAGTNIKSLFLGRNIPEPIDIYLNIDSITTLTVGKNVNELPFNLDYEWEGKYCATQCSVIYSLSETPQNIKFMRFPSSVYVNAKLYVPIGSKEKYSTAYGWKNFFNIEEIEIEKMWNGDGEPINNKDEKSKCGTPIINYNNGEITFGCETEGVEFVSEIKDTDIKNYISSSIKLSATYNISVYATKTGYKNSETATATLCWIEAEPKTEGITDGIANIPARTVMIQNLGSTINIQGMDDGTQVNVYSISGTQEGSAISNNGIASVNTNLQPGSIVIVKIGDKSVKFIIK